MSKKIDERVVEMRFDNKQFESATKESMSTLDKLKQKLQLKDATKGLDNLEKAAKRVDLNPLGKSAEMVTAKFSAMQVAGVTAIANLTNSAVNAGKNITKALTIEPVITGFQEYETQIGAIQTILANTQKEGTNVERVNAALDELNLYADQTIYNFTEMTRNIGTFTAAGVKLDDSVSAIKGIANLAAVSGSTSLQASTAMYQLSQALAAGKVSLMDWNSVVNAGMGGQVFQDALIRTSENLKTGAKDAIATYGTFRESLTQGAWLTTEVLTETLGQLAGAYSEADLLAKGYSAEQAKEIVQLAETAKGAATDVKTFTQLWDTLKEAVQSGWGQTWRMIVGDFDEAKERMTKLSTLFGGIIEKASNRRNSMLSGALDSSWTKLTTKLGDAGIKTEDFQNKIIELAKTHNVNLNEMIEKEGSFEKALKKAFSSGKLDKSILMDAIKSFVGGIKDSANAANAASDQIEKYGEIVNKVIRGDFGNGAERIEKLTKAGYDYATVQNLVNKKLGSSVRHLSSLTDEQIQNADSLADLSDEQLKSKGYTEEQIIALKDLKKAADDSNSSIYKLINGFEKPSGVELAWGSVFNIIDSITESCKAVKKAWTEIFHPGMTEDQIIAERSERLYKLLESVHAFTEGLKVNEKTADKITRTFKGLFAILDIIRIIISGPLGLAFRAIKKILSKFDLDVLDVTAAVGDAVVKFRDWIESVLDFNKVFEPLSKLVKGFVKVIRDWFDEFKKTEEVQNLTRKIREFGEAIHLDGSAADNFKKITEGLSALFIKLSLVLNASLLSGLKVLGAVLNLFGTNLADLAAKLIDYLAKAKIWVNENILIANTIDEVAKIVKTLIDGIKNCAKAFMALEPVQKFIENFKNSFASLFGIVGKLFSGFGVENFANGLAKAFESLQKWITSLNNSDNIGRDIILGLLNGLKAGAGTVISFIIQLGKNLLEAIKGVLGIHSPSTEGFDIGKNFILGIINGIKQMISNLLSLLGDVGQKCIDIISKIDFSKIFTLAISAGIIYSGKKIYDLAEKFAAPLEGLGKMFGGIGKMTSSLGKVFDQFAATMKVKKWEIISKSILNFAIAIGILAAAIYALSTIEDSSKLWESVAVIGALALIMLILAKAMESMSGSSASISKEGVKISGVKTALISIGIALLLMAATVKMVGKLNPEQAKQGFLGLAGLVGAIAIVAIAFGTFVKGKSAQNIDKFGKMMTKLSIALLLMVAVVKLIDTLSPSAMIKGAEFLGGYIVFISLLAVVASFAKKSATQINSLGSMLLKISAAIIIMALACKLINTLSPDAMVKGVYFLIAFVAFVGILVAVTKIGKEEQIAKVGRLVLAISAAILIMALACKIINTLSYDTIGKGIAFLLVFAMFVGILVAVTKIGKEEQIAKVSATILAVSVAIGILAAVCVLLGLVNTETLKKGVGAVAILGVMMAAMLAASKGAEKAKGAIVAMTVAIGIMAAAVVTLSFIPWDRLWPAVAGMSVLMIVFGVMAKLAGSAKGSMAPLIVMTVAVGLLAGVIYVLAQLPIGSVLESAAALSVLLLSMSVSMAILSKVGVNVKDALVGALGLLAMAVPLIAFVGVLAVMSNVQNAMQNAIILAAFATVMTGLLVVLTGIGIVYAATGGLAATGILGLLAMAVPLIAFVGVLAVMQGVQNAEANANVLISLMTAMTNLLTQVSILGPLALVGVVAIKAMAAVMVALAALVVAVGALNEKFPQLEMFLDSGISLLSRLASGMGQVIGSFVSGLAAGLISSLPAIADNLSSFMLHLTPFIIGAKMLDESSLKNVQTLISIMAALTGASLLEGIASWFGGGGGSLVEFANQLVPFGLAMMAFSTTVTGINEGAVTAAANAGKMMAEMAKSIPREGGWWAEIAGEKDLASFGLKIMAYGSAIKAFSEFMSDFTINETAITAAANAGKQMSELANDMPKSGGIWQSIAGEQDIAKFGLKMTMYAGTINSFAKSIKGLKVDEGAMTSAINAGKKMTEFSEIIPKSGGWWSKIAGEKDIGNFGKKISAFGTAIKEFSESVSGKISGVDSAISSVNKLLSMLRNVSGINSEAIDAFKKSLKSLGKTSVDGFIKSFDGADARAKVVINNFLNTVSSTVKDKKEPLNMMLNDLGKYLVDGFVKGINDNAFKATKAGKELAENALKAARAKLKVESPSKEFMKVGAFVVAGFANGINKNVGDAEKAARGMSNSVLEATQDTLGIHSPSVVFDKKVGRYIVQGIAEGITKDMSAEEAAEKKANNIVSAFQNGLDAVDRAVSNRGKDFDLWQLTDGETASDVAILEKQRKKLNDDLSDYNQQVKLTTDEWLTLKDNFGENHKATQEAYGKMIDAKITLAQTTASLLSIDKSIISNQEEHMDNWKTINENGLEIMELESSNGYIVSDAYKDSRYIEVYTDNLNIAKTNMDNAEKAYADALAKYGDPNHSVVQEARKDYQEKWITWLQEMKALSDYKDSITDRELQNIEDSRSHREDIIARWEAAYGDDANDKQRYLFYKNMYDTDFIEAGKEFRVQLKAYEDFVNELAEKNGITIEEAKRTKEAVDFYNNKVYTAQTKVIEASKKVNDHRKEYLEQQKEDLKDEYETASDIAELKYQIWEKTTGRNATDTEKETMKLAMLSEQLGKQAKLVEMAKDAWKNAKDDEKLKYEKEYLNAQLELANLQSDVLDIQEENIKRQERALDRQRLAQDEYNDYINKYEKYYLEHGMTREQLEKDAKLVSGYDPNKAINTAVSKTNNAIDTIKTNMSKITEAVGEGIQNGISTVTDSTTTMLKTCEDILDKSNESWAKAGVALVASFISGIQSKLQDAVQAGFELASKTLEAMLSVIDSDMEYSPTITPVLDMSKVSAGASKLNSMLTGNTSLGLAKSISASTATKARNDLYAAKLAEGNGSRNVYEFTQNNYSPKALSSVEIYRQTNNMISRIGKKVTQV